MNWDIQSICKANPKTAYRELNELDPLAVFR